MDFSYKNLEQLDLLTDQERKEYVVKRDAFHETELRTQKEAFEKKDRELEEVRKALTTIESKLIQFEELSNESKINERDALIEQLRVNLKPFEDKVTRSAHTSNTILELETRALINIANAGANRNAAGDGNAILKYRKTFVQDMFTFMPTQNGFFNSFEVTAEVRDAKGVVNCTVSTHNTSLSATTVPVPLYKFRDLVDVCIDLLEDHPRLLAMVNWLLNTSMKNAIERALVANLGNGLGDGNGNLLSLQTVSSVFDPANALAPFTLTNGINARPTLIDLIAVMKAQIYVFGEGKYNPDIVLVNYTDWTRLMSAQDTQGRYLICSNSDGTWGIDGMTIMPTPAMPLNTVIIGDTSVTFMYGESTARITASYENGTNFEREIVTLKALQRFQFYVPTFFRNSWMRASSISAALNLTPSATSIAKS